MHSSTSLEEEVFTLTHDNNCTLESRGCRLVDLPHGLEQVAVAQQIKLTCTNMLTGSVEMAPRLLLLKWSG